MIYFIFTKHMIIYDPYSSYYFILQYPILSSSITISPFLHFVFHFTYKRKQIEEFMDSKRLSFPSPSGQFTLLSYRLSACLFFIFFILHHRLIFLRSYSYAILYSSVFCYPSIPCGVMFSYHPVLCISIFLSLQPSFSFFVFWQIFF